MSGSFALRSVQTVLTALLVLGSLTVHSSQRPGAFTALATDPETPSILYAGTSEQGVLKSEDGGATWKPTGLGNARVSSLAIELENPNIVYAGTLGSGVYKSVDAGTTWHASNVGLRALNVTELTIAPRSPIVLYAVIADVGVFKSTDGAATWTLSSQTCSAEDCANGIDDDCDGLIDGADADCGGSGNCSTQEECAPGYRCGYDGYCIPACEVQECGGSFCPSGYVCGWDGCCVNHCIDGLWNGTEGDVDCGRDCPVKCRDGQRCSSLNDCESGRCELSVCMPATPAVLTSLSLNPGSVPTGIASTGTVILTEPAAGGATVTLSSSHPAVAIVPAFVRVAATSTTANFTVSTTSVATLMTVTISAYFHGVTKSATLIVNPVLLTSLSLNPTNVIGGSLSAGTVTLSGAAPAGGVLVALSTSNAAVANVPATLVVTPGSTTADFSVSTGASCTSATAIISAAYAGTNKSGVLAVNAIAPDTVTIQRADYFSKQRSVRIRAASSNNGATLQVSVTSSGALIGTLNNQGGGAYSGQFEWPADPQSITVRSSSCGSATSLVTSKQGELP